MKSVVRNWRDKYAKRFANTLCAKPLHEEDDGNDGKGDGDNWQVGTDAFESFDGRIDLLVNGYRRQMVRDGNMLDIPDICELLEAELLGVVLEDEEIIISQNHGEPVIGKHTVSDTCYQNIARRIAGMEVAIPDYLHHKGMFSRFFWRNHAGKLV